MTLKPRRNIRCQSWDWSAVADNGLKKTLSDLPLKMHAEEIVMLPKKKKKKKKTPWKIECKLDGY